MPALQYDLTIEQGSEYRLEAPVLNLDGQPQDMAGWTVRGQIRQTVSDATAIDLGDHLSLSDSTLTISIPSAVSSAWAWTEGVYDVELIDPALQVTRFLSGRVLVSPEITR